MLTSLGSSEETSRLVIIADDLGWHPRIDKAIIELLEKGCLSGASLAVNAPYFSAVVKELTSRPEIAKLIGAHLNVYRGAPCSSTQALSPLLNGGKFCRSLIRIAAATALSSKVRRAVIDEFRTQLNMMLESGIQPAFINSEKHVHWLPTLWKEVLRLANDWNVRYVRSCSCVGGSSKARLMRVIGSYNNSRLRSPESGIQSCSYLYGVGDYGADLGKAFLKWESDAGSGLSEVVCHPGAGVDEYRDYPEDPEFSSFLDSARVLEFEFLKTTIPSHNLSASIAQGDNLPSYSRKKLSIAR